MTIDEVSERYQIPAEILREYEGWGLCGADSVSWQCGKQDLERLSLIMTLHDIGVYAPRSGRRDNKRKKDEDA